ncbi:MAG: FAD-binding dehydrogenase [Sneathiellales bacterium]|nr:FAD-binding dehydrogenase [Sneathiellales bacterium]
MSEGYDAIVVGAGIAGLVTALELVEGGKKILILDRDKKENLGGLAKESFGGMFFVDSPVQRKGKIRDNPELAYSDWLQFAEFGEQDHWPRQWAKTYIERSIPDIYEVITKRGIDFFPVVNWVERGLYIPGNSVPRFHLVWGTGYELANVHIRQLQPFIDGGQVTIGFGACVQEVLTSGGYISGVAGEYEAEGKAFEFGADTVILAAGGINGSDDAVRQHWQSDWGAAPPAVILNGSHKYADGTLHAAATAVGGSVTHLDKMWNYAAGVHHPRPRKPRHGLSLVPSKTALWLDAEGKRFGPEPLVSGFDTWDLVRRICQQDHKYSWAVLNRKIALKELAISGAEFNPAVRDKKKIAFLKTILFGNKALLQDMTTNCIDFVTAGSVEQLVEKMNALENPMPVREENIQKAIRDYDAQLDRPRAQRNDDQLRRIQHLRQYRGDKVRTVKEQKILDPEAMPLIAIRQFVISRKSLGGIQTDLQSRVLDEKGEVISGLYAVGEAAGFGGGGMHGKRALEGTFLGGCVLTARYAVKSVLEGE